MKSAPSSRRTVAGRERTAGAARCAVRAPLKAGRKASERLAARLTVASGRPAACLKQLAASGAAPKQMLWGMWWCVTLPSLFRTLATIALAAAALRQARHFL
jgi:hypothetical protein